MITQEELNQRPMTTTLVPMYDENDMGRFAIMLRFPCGLNQVWTINGPDYPPDDEWVKAALQKLLEMMIADLREGRSEPRVKRNKQAFRETNWESTTAALQGALIQWVQRRRQWAAAHAAPAAIQ